MAAPRARKQWLRFGGFGDDPAEFIVLIEYNWRGPHDTHVLTLDIYDAEGQPLNSLPLHTESQNVEATLAQQFRPLREDCFEELLKAVRQLLESPSGWEEFSGKVQAYYGADEEQLMDLGLLEEPEEEDLEE